MGDDGCGTAWPPKWPGPWAGHGPGEPPGRLVGDMGRVVGAIVFTSVGSRLGEGDLATAFLKGAEALAETATSS